MNIKNKLILGFLIIVFSGCLLNGCYLIFKDLYAGLQVPSSNPYNIGIWLGLALIVLLTLLNKIKEIKFGTKTEQLNCRVV